MNNSLHEASKELKNKLKKAYRAQVYPHIKHLENLRKQCLLFTYFVYFVATAFFICLPFIAYDEKSVFKTCMIIIIAGYSAYGLFKLLISLISYIYTRNFKKYYNILTEAVGLKWSEGGIRDIPAELQNSKLFFRANTIKYDDIFTGQYKDVSLKIAESKIINDDYNSHKSHHHRITVFKGVIIYFKSNKNIPCTTLIKPKHEYIWRKILNNLAILILLGLSLFLLIDSITTSNMDGIIFGGALVVIFGVLPVFNHFQKAAMDTTDLQQLQLEDVNLAKYFNAYSFSQIEGRYLLTTAFIERFMNLTKTFKNNGIRCSYVGNHLVLAIPENKNMFEIGDIYTSLNNPNHIDKFIDEIVSILLLVEYFKLDTNTNL